MQSSDHTSLADTAHPFERLTPDFIIDAIEHCGYLSDGRLLALNSYENRVYQVGIEGAMPMIAKFYRPERWSVLQIQEEHDFCFELKAHELPVVTPVLDDKSETIHEYEGFHFALYPRQGGRAPEFDNLDNLLIIGRMLGRMHRIGALRPFQHRPALTLASHGQESVDFLLAHFIPTELQTAYATLASDLLQGIEQAFAQAQGVKPIRVHGDCHAGNVLWRDDMPHFVDFDDARMAPAMQDMWMLLSGERDRRMAQLSEIAEGYSEFNDFPANQLALIEALRTLRIMHYSAWIARRWQDPAFPMNFPWFNTQRYWSDHILALREQFAALQEPPLMLW